jgi:hypothetical protein
VTRETGGSPAVSDERNVIDFVYRRTVINGKAVNIAPHVLEMLDDRSRTIMKEDKLLLNKLHPVV